MNKQLFSASGILAINAVAENMPFAALIFSDCKNLSQVLLIPGKNGVAPEGQGSTGYPDRRNFRISLNCLISWQSYPIANKDATRQAKLSQVASFCNFPRDVRNNKLCLLTTFQEHRPSRKRS